MKRLKIIEAVTFFFALAFILTGCGAGTPDTTDTEAPDTVITETETDTGIALIKVFDRYFSPDTVEIALEKDEIESFDALLSSLQGFFRLTLIDLDGFELSINEKQLLNESFPGAEIKCATYIKVSDKKIYTTDTEMDLSGIPGVTAAAIREALSYLPDVVRVVADAEIPIEDKNSLRSDFPGVSFEIPGVVSVYGVTVREDAAELDLNGIQIDPAVLSAKLEYLPYMKTVSLYDTGLDGDEQYALASEYPDIKFLWKVEILGELYDTDTTDLDLSGKKELTVNTVRKKLRLMSWLCRADLSDISATDEELGALRGEFPDIKIVWKLYMGKWSLKTDAVAFSVLIYDYDYTRLTSDDIQCLKYCTDLQALDLGHQALTDLSVIGEYLTELRILILADNKISDLTPLSNLKHLHYIELFVNRPLKDVSPLGECKELVDVNISHLYDIWDISNLLDLPLLERLWIEHTSISDKDVLRLRETYPDTKIIVEGYGSVDQGWREHPRYYAMIDMFKKTDYVSEEFSKYDR